jgi:putative DNA methylase
MLLSPNRVNKMRLIETDEFDFEFLSQLAERESWRKEVHRPTYHIHKWWATRLGSVFRGIVLGSLLSSDENISEAFYSSHDFSNMSVFDPFMGSGTTIGEAHKLGLVALGRDINPVAAESVRVALGTVDYVKLNGAFRKLSEGIGERIRSLYRSTDRNGHPCDVLYYFWVMRIVCPQCASMVDLFPSWVIARNAYPNRKPEIQILCPSCGDIFPGIHGEKVTICRSCGFEFSPEIGTAKGTNAICQNCNTACSILDAVDKRNERPSFRLYGKLILTEEGAKAYLPATEADSIAYKACSEELEKEMQAGTVILPNLELADGYNTKQAMRYGFKIWRDFFNDRQLLGLSWLHEAIAAIPDQDVRDALLLLFSGILEFNNMFASYKGEGTGAVRHMFAHHILKPERTPIEANIWGTPRSSGAFSNLFRSRLLRAIEYRAKPGEVNGVSSEKGIVCSAPFTGKVEPEWPTHNNFLPRAIYLSCGDSSTTRLPDQSIDLVVTDPPFFNNVHYSELADFFYAWQQLVPRGFINREQSTRSQFEVQDEDQNKFARKLQGVFQECHRVLKDNGLLVFTYHHSRDEGWASLASAILKAGFIVVNSHPVKSEMSVATPKSQATEPIQLDIIIVCRKMLSNHACNPDSSILALEKAHKKLLRLQTSGFSLSQNDRKIVMYGQLLTSLKTIKDIELLPALIEKSISTAPENLSAFPATTKEKSAVAYNGTRPQTIRPGRNASQFDTFKQAQRIEQPNLLQAELGLG